MTELVVHSARKIDAAGEIDGFWFAAYAGTITATGSGEGWRTRASATSSVVDAHGRHLVPGFVDLHGHGAGGFAFDDGAYAISKALAVHRAHGTTRSVISLVANPVDELSESLTAVADLVAEDELVLGSHLEGPFLAAERKGAHNPEFLIDPSPAAVERLIAAARGTLRQITLAIERENALEAIDVFVEAGVQVAVGHTEATFEQAADAFDRGARLLTHAFNAMPGIGHRAPGPVVAALEDPRVTVELILDGVHVAPPVAKLAFGAAPGRIALITDAMAATGSPDGAYKIGSLDVAVVGGVARLQESDGSLGSIAGSTLTLDVALRNAIELAGLSPVDAVAALTAVPARALGLEHRLGLLAPGFAADAVLLDHEWSVCGVWGAGTKLA
ncbi:N-acetylglucosamine-6-phosphate deacetylase [Gryllotalpicola protaetiae]|uniref:N-acetylglucosamine-6-phosphate deacetylase n=1 Tax=Gryllotalpicola protaetiae TaxID=2419771 RepID=A0A387BKP1_9MICO|nr:N-acetylglucosamine-6-phosphate deacetylase [Gryllotalpicola protaetiae]AYG02892.1 N-acetylglucosamine-6-phosphate deacetylase [Gryllotalpicola protaetiae]